MPNRTSSSWCCACSWLRLARCSSSPQSPGSSPFRPGSQMWTCTALLILSAASPFLQHSGCRQTYLGQRMSASSSCWLLLWFDSDLSVSCPLWSCITEVMRFLLCQLAVLQREHLGIMHHRTFSIFGEGSDFVICFTDPSGRSI